MRRGLPVVLAFALGVALAVAIPALRSTGAGAGSDRPGASASPGERQGSGHLADHDDAAAPVSPADADTGHDHEVAVPPAFPEEVDGEQVTVLSGDYPDGYVVEEGEVALIDGEVSMARNLVVRGVLRMRPGGHLIFRDTDMRDYVGADDQIHQEIVESDVGLWVTGAGVLDIQGTPKQGWNRTGEHPTWEPDDEYWISPTDHGDHDPRPWRPGDPIPRYDPRVPPAEVINVTRDIVIQGPAHIHIHSQRPQRIEYVQLRDMGVSNGAHEGPVLGRYALHLHHGLDGTRGTVIRGVASIDARGRVFVPHLSHGITMTDVVSVNSYAEVLWWDKGDKTEDLLVDGLAATGVHMPPSVAGTNRNISVVVLKSNERAEIRNSAVSGARGNRRALGFHWNTTKAHRMAHRAVWDFHDNVTHNNEGHGLRFWFNDSWDHHVRDTVIYNNGSFGIENGAYTNAIRYTNVLLLDNASGGILHHSSSNAHRGDDGPSRYRQVTVEGPGPAVEVGRLRGTPKTRQEFIDCDLGGKIVLDTGGKTSEPFIALFRRCRGVTPDDFVFGNGRPAAAMDGTSVIIEHPDGREWELTVEGREVVVTQHR